MFYLTSSLSLVVTALSAYFFIGAAEPLLASLAVLSATLLVIGLTLQRTNVRFGIKISIAGTGAVALSVMISLGQLIHYVPSDQPGQRVLFIAPSLALGVLGLHAAASFGKFQAANDEALMAELKRNDPLDRQ